MFLAGFLFEIISLKMWKWVLKKGHLNLHSVAMETNILFVDITLFFD